METIKNGSERKEFIEWLVLGGYKAKTAEAYSYKAGNEKKQPMIVQRLVPQFRAWKREADSKPVIEPEAERLAYADYLCSKLEFSRVAAEAIASSTQWKGCYWGLYSGYRMLKDAAQVVVEVKASDDCESAIMPSFDFDCCE